MANKNIFQSVKLLKPRYNMFDLSHDVKLTFKMGELIPTLCTEVVPGDKFKIGAESLLRFQPLISPVMHRMDVTMHYFFVPNRLIWEGWEKFITGDATAPAFPYIEVGGTTTNSFPLMDYFGIPYNPVGTEAERLNALPFAAYQAIYHEYYRDQNLIPEFDYKCINGAQDNHAVRFALRRRAWGHDYFTSALPTPQQGGAVDVPLGDVRLKSDWADGGREPRFAYDDLGWSAGDVVQDANGTEVSGQAAAYDPDGTLETSPTTINELRRAFRLQEFLERSMRGGKRYIEQIKSHFGITSSDKRLQRPEYITGVKTPVVISEVLNTSDTTNAPQGNMSGHAVAALSGNNGYYKAEEHGFIIGIMSCIPLTAYQNGIPKHFLKVGDRYQYYWPEFANLGEQAVENRELYAYTPTGKDTFGYVPRYSEYKYEPNRVAGQMRSSLNHWHLGRIFDSQPALNQQFVECSPSDRIFAVNDGSDNLVCQVYHKISAIRPMPYHGTPML